MAYTAQYGAKLDEKKSLANGYVFGAPVKDLGWFGSLLITLAIGLGGFLLGTCVSIFAMLATTAGGHHPDFGQTYRFFGLPLGATAMVLTAGYLGTFWVRRITRKA